MYFNKWQLWQFKLSDISEDNMHIIIQDEGRFKLRQSEMKKSKQFVIVVFTAAIFWKLNFSGTWSIPVHLSLYIASYCTIDRVGLSEGSSGAHYCNGQFKAVLWFGYR